MSHEYHDVWLTYAAPCLRAEESTRMRCDAPKWSQGDAEERNCWMKSLFLFSLRTKSILVHSKKCWVKTTQLGNPALGEYWTEHMLCY